MALPFKNTVQGSASAIAGKAMAYLVMGLFALLTLYPQIWLALNSFKSTNEFRMNMLGLPMDWTLENYIGAWKIGEFNRLIGNSIFYTAGSTAVALKG